MAACQIDFTGSGKTLIRYTHSAVEYFITVIDGGLIFLDDGDTNFFYTHITGNLVPVPNGGCITITEDAYDCQLLEWSDIEMVDAQINSITFNGEEFFFAIRPDFPVAGIQLCSSINSVADDRFKVISYKRSQLVNGNVNCSYLVRTIGATEPVGITVINDDGNEFVILGEEMEVCTVPEDHTLVNTCDNAMLD